MYSFAIYLYMLAVNLAALFGNKKARLMMRGHCDTWRILRERIKPDDRPVWFHAASLGEFEQGRLLIERLKNEQPQRKVLLTFFSPSGYEVRKDYEHADVVCYLPFDTMLNARKFLRLAHPSMAVFIKYEFWADYLFQCHRRGVPVYSVSSIFRPNQIFFRWYNCGYSHVLRWVTHFFVQNEESKELLAAKGLHNVTITGDTRLDRVIQIKEQACHGNTMVIETFTKGKKCFVAGSSWEPDEDLFLPYFAAHREWKLVVAPHVISDEHLARIEKQAKDLSLSCKKLSFIHDLIDSTHGDMFSALRGTDIIIIDRFGLLSTIYRYATVAYVGGGFGVGIHNVPEAAVYGIPVIFGPNNKKFQEAQALLRCGGSFEVSTPGDFAALMDRFDTDSTALEEAGRAAAGYIAASAGASEHIYQAIFSD